MAGVWLLVACNFLVEQCGKIPQGHHVRASCAQLSTRVVFTCRQGPWCICQAGISCSRMVSLDWAYCYLG